MTDQNELISLIEEVDTYQHFSPRSPNLFGIPIATQRDTLNAMIDLAAEAARRFDPNQHIHREYISDATRSRADGMATFALITRQLRDLQHTAPRTPTPLTLEQIIEQPHSCNQDDCGRTLVRVVPAISGYCRVHRRVHQTLALPTPIDDDPEWTPVTSIDDLQIGDHVRIQGQFASATDTSWAFFGLPLALQTNYAIGTVNAFNGHPADLPIYVELDADSPVDPGRSYNFPLFNMERRTR